MNKHLEFINGQWCIVDHDTGEYTGSKKVVGKLPNQEEEPEEMFGSLVLDVLILHLLPYYMGVMAAVSQQC